MKKIKMALAGMVVAAGMLAISAPAMAAECPAGTQWEGTVIGGDSGIKSIAQCNMPKEEGQAKLETDNLWPAIQNIINWVLAALGLVAVIMIIVGGFNYMTSQGDTAKTKKGRDSILYGIIGLLIALLAFAIVNFVLNNVFNKTEPAAPSQSNPAPSQSNPAPSQVVE